MCNIFFQLVYAKPDTYSSYDDTTTSFQPSEPRWNVFLFSTTTVAIPIHPHIWLAKTYLYTRNQPNRHLLTPTASAKKASTFDIHAMDDNDETLVSETDHGTVCNKEFKSGTYRGMLCGIVLRDYPEQVLSLSKVKSVPANMREFLSCAQRQYRIDVTTSTVERKIGGLACSGACPDGCKCFSRKGSNAQFIRLTCQICCTVQWGRT